MSITPSALSGSQQLAASVAVEGTHPPECARSCTCATRKQPCLLLGYPARQAEPWISLSCSDMEVPETETHRAVHVTGDEGLESSSSCSLDSHIKEARSFKVT